VCTTPQQAKQSTKHNSMNKHSYPCVPFVPAPACIQNRGRQEATAMCKRQGLETQRVASKNRPPQGQPNEGTAAVTDSGATACGAAALLRHFRACSLWHNGGIVLEIMFPNSQYMVEVFKKRTRADEEFGGHLAAAKTGPPFYFLITRPKNTGRNMDTILGTRFGIATAKNSTRSLQLLLPLLPPPPLALALPISLPLLATQSGYISFPPSRLSAGRTKFRGQPRKDNAAQGAASLKTCSPPHR
jgi:hypothetical protein